MEAKILIVDDEQNIREIIKDLLQVRGYKVTTAVDGQDALDKMKYENFDLYILDVFMPNLNGIDLMKKIKEKFPLAVIIISTGYSSINGALNAIRNGAFHYISKPIDGEELFNIVDKGVKHYADLTKNMNKSDDEIKTKDSNRFDTIMLHGFNEEEKKEFHDLSVLRTYKPSEVIKLEENIGTLIFVESGEISVQLGDIIIDKLESGSSWGEETFMHSNNIFTKLVAQKETVIKQYSRKNILEYFNYKSESLLKRYMINLLNMMYVKWKYSLRKIGMLMGYNPHYKI
ncbi:MAG: response regulator [Candidatus Cloacimonetes bacterium]|nr:response regulator [Candidatus Cloacimonadota bacterium]